MTLPNIIMDHLLTGIVFLPVIGILIILLLPSNRPSLIRWTSAAFTFLPLCIAAELFLLFNRNEAGFQFVEKFSWIPTFNIHYYIGTDGLSITMLLLTATVV